jgi:Fe-Mn family superoxide dismutase
MNRREALMSLAAAPTALVLGAEAPPAAPAGRAVKPLPFNASKLKGLSEKMLSSHHDHNYAGAVKALSKVEEHLARIKEDTPGFLVAGLKERELSFRNSVTLHEAYFGNLGGDGKVPPAFAPYEEPLRTCAVSLGGGSGWTILSLLLESGELRIDNSGNHTQVLAASVPLLVLDMYEHAYAIDYGAAAQKYVDAFMANVKWDEVQRRYEVAQKMHALMK